jgi:hypothetical protein
MRLSKAESFHPEGQASRIPGSFNNFCLYLIFFIPQMQQGRLYDLSGLSLQPIPARADMPASFYGDLTVDCSLLTVNYLLCSSPQASNIFLYISGWGKSDSIIICSFANMDSA